MKRKFRAKETWDDFEKRVGMKRSGTDAKKAGVNVPNDILVQRMSPNASGRLKKYEPLDTRDFIPFEDYEELTLDNIKEACEKFYKAPEGSCDILASDRGPSCTKLEQLKGKKVYFIRFLPPEHVVADCNPQTSSPVKASSSVPINPVCANKSVVTPKSLSISQLLRAGKLVRPLKENIVSLELETFDIQEMKWVKKGSYKFDIEENKFSSGAFRDSFKARAISPEMQSSLWVVKQYQLSAVDTITDDLHMTLEDHTRKQVQMHIAASSITKTFSSNVPKEFGDVFHYNKVYYAVYNGQPITIEQYVDGTFYKYVNNDGNCTIPHSDKMTVIFEKAQCLVHYSFIKFQKNLMLLDLQGSGYMLYDPEIATSQLVKPDEVVGVDEIYFCAGNLSKVAIENFIVQHQCNNYCKMVNLEPLDDL